MRWPSPLSKRLLPALALCGVALAGWWGSLCGLSTPEQPVSRSAEVRQWSSESCGPAALATLSNAYGISWSIPALERACRLSHQGTSLDNLCEAARGQGFRAEALRATAPLGLLRVPRPFVAYLAKRHYVVVEAYRDGRFALYDPTSGQVVHSTPAELFRDSQGWLLSVTRLARRH